MAFNFSPTSYTARPLDFSALANLPENFWKGQEVGRQKGLRDALGQGLPTMPDGSIDWAKAASIVGQFDPQLGMRTAAYAQQNTLTPYQSGMLDVAKGREERLAQAPEVTPAQKRALEIQEERLGLAKEAASRLPQNTIGGVAMIDSADKELNKDNRAILTRDWSATEMAQSAIAMGPVGRAQRAVRGKVEAALRLMTGAAAPEQEIVRYTDMYMPGALDSIETKKQKLRLLDEFGVNAKNNALRGHPLPSAAPDGAEVAPATQPNELPVFNAPQEAPQKVDAAQATRWAQEAIAAGKDPEAVRAKLKEMGYDLGQ
jgi:hypothetical protein